MSARRAPNLTPADSTVTEDRPEKGRCCQPAAKAGGSERNAEGCLSNLSEVYDHVTLDVLTAEPREGARTQTEYAGPDGETQEKVFIWLKDT